MKTDSLLAEARKSLLSGDPFAAMSSLAELTEHIEKARFDRSEIASLRAELGRLHGLAEAAIEGHAQAKEAVAEILARAGVLKTYDEAGRETVHPTSLRSSGKINHNF